MSMERTGARVMLHFISQGNNIEFTYDEIANFSIRINFKHYITTQQKCQGIYGINVVFFGGFDFAIYRAMA